MIPVFEPEIGDLEISMVTDALKKGEISGSFGHYITDFENAFAKYCGAKYGVAVSSGTTALEVAVAAINLNPGDEVLVSACTNIATALAVYRNQAVAVSVDSENRTWNLDLDLIEDLITPKTKAIIPVHIYGHPVDMDKLMKIAKKHNLVVIEDDAEAHGAEVNGKRVGALGDMGCFSFYANKIITTGEGGMITTNNEGYAKQLRLLRNLAFTQPRFWHEVPGYNFRMTGMQAALGMAQMSKIDRFIESRRHLASLYNKYLSEITELQLPVEEPWAKNVYWMYSVVLKSENKTREELTKFLYQKGIDTRTMFCPMNMQPFLKKQPGYREVSCPVAENLWENGFYLPSSSSVTEENVAYISKTLKEFFSKK
ncbi:MAG: DegT/DnrJ/EryC1/StrS family aminotransferase [Oligoflexia bacterium]|nr:DegT/DnrJ/EryC1/StrS family aminotransferase [Oligoflexia bacterium]